MKKSSVLIGVIIFFLFIFGLIAYLFFKGGTWFISSIDGNNANSNYIHITKNYYLLKAEKTICKNSENIYKRLTAPVDSLSWNEMAITGYSRNQYFSINTATQKISYFSSKYSLLQSIVTIPSQTLREIPEIK